MHNYIIEFCIVFHRIALTVFLFGVRGFATGFFQAIVLYTPEVSYSNCTVIIWMCQLNNNYCVLCRFIPHQLELLACRCVQASVALEVCFLPILPRYVMFCHSSPSQNILMLLLCYTYVWPLFGEMMFSSEISKY